MKNWFRVEELFQGIKGRLTRRGPVPSQVLLCEVDERVSNV